MKGFRGRWVIIPNGKHYTIVGAKRLPRKTKKFCTKTLNRMQGTNGIIRVNYFANGRPKDFDFNEWENRG